MALACSVCAALSSAPHHLLLLDGRIHNANALRRELGDTTADLPDSPAGIAPLFAAAYRRWGLDFPHALSGEFVFALWDAAERRLILGRDPAGLRPMYFLVQGDRLFFGSHALSVLQLAGRSPAADEARVAEWLGAGLHTSDRTFFQGVRMLPAGNVLVWQAGRSRTHTFWHPDRIPELRLRDPREYAEAARSILYRAVERCLPQGCSIGSHLSGGLDSSTVTDTAARLLAPSGRTLTAFTAVPALPVDAAIFPGRFVDETGFAQMVAHPHGNVEHVLVSNHAVPLLASTDALSDAMERPLLNPANGVWMYAILQEARQRGIGAMLDGWMSNFTFSYDGKDALAELLRRGQLLPAARLAFGYHRHDARWRHIAALGLLPLLPAAWRSAIGRLRSGQRGAGAEHFTCANNTFLQCFRDAGPTPRGGSLGRQRRTVHIQGLENEMYCMMARSLGMESFGPTADREVLEFCLAVPEVQFAAGGDRRALLRNTMSGLLPGPVLRERRKGLQAADAFPLMLAERPALLQEIRDMRNLDLVRRAIDLPRLDRLVAAWPGHMRSAADYMDYCVALPRAVSMGRFLRRMEQGALPESVPAQHPTSECFC